MAMSSTTACMPPYGEITMLALSKPANICSTIPRYNNTTSTHFYGRSSFSKGTKILRFVVRSSDEASTTSTTVTWEGEGDSLEVAKGPPSIVSALNVEKALRGIAITDVDHYGRLGLRRGCAYELVEEAYQNKVNEISNQGLDEEELNDKLDLLKESYRILSTVEERRLYDWSLGRSEAPERYVWPFEVDSTQTIDFGTPPPQEPENVGPTIAVGYFLLGWIVLSFILSILLNQL